MTIHVYPWAHSIPIYLTGQLQSKKGGKDKILSQENSDFIYQTKIFLGLLFSWKKKCVDF